MTPPLSEPRPPRSRLRTYSHLSGQQRMPTEYELLTSRLLYHPQRGFEVAVPLADWYRRYQQGSPLACPDWERFADPRETTYSKYTRLQRDREIEAEGILRLIEETGGDRQLAEPWRAVLARGLAPARFPFHGFQMIAAYLGQMAPSGRITVAALFQGADEIRRIQRIAYRVTQIALEHPGFGDDSRALWERDPMWQPLREAVERLLVAWDWGESFVGLNLCLKPMVDDLFGYDLPALAARRGDALLAALLHTFRADAAWQRDWSGALVRMAIADRGENRGVIQGWIDRWFPVAARAIAPLGALLESDPAEAVAARRRALEEMGLGAPP